MSVGIKCKKADIPVTIHSRFDGSTNKAELQHRFQCSDVFLGRLDREDFGNRIRIPFA